MTSRAFEDLWVYLRGNRPVAVHQHLIHVTGNTKAALLLSQLVYWTRHSPYARGVGGWLHKSSNEWFKELGMSRHETDSARNRLKALNVLEEARWGMPALRYYCLKLPELGRLLSTSLDRPVIEPLDLDVLCTNEPLVRELLGRSLPYHRKLAYLTEQINVALLLTRLIHQYRRYLGQQGWSLLSASAIERELGLTRWEQESARECLRIKQLIEERMEYLPSRLYVRAMPAMILTALRHIDATDNFNEPAASVNAAVGIPTIKPPDCLTVRHSGHRENKADSQLLPMLTLTFPGEFLPAEQALAAKALTGLPTETAQLVLDEVAGMTRKGRRVDSRVALVRSLVKAEEEGRFVPGYAWEVKANREHAVQCEDERRRRQAQEQSEADVIQREFHAQADGKSGYEAFKALTSGLRQGRNGQVKVDG